MRGKYTLVIMWLLCTSEWLASCSALENNVQGIRAV